MSSNISHPLFAAIYDPSTWLLERTSLPPHREYLIEGVTGRVLDLGAGTGAMFPYFARQQKNESAVSVHAIEPDPHMRKRAETRAAEVGLDIEIRSARAESLPYPAGSFDVVVASMVFCTIENVDEALQEVTRVLNPGGEFRFLEHVEAEGWLARVQSFCSPLWRRLAGGCHLTRRQHKRFEAASEFSVREIERLRIGIPPVRPFVRGRLQRREASDSDTASEFGQL